MSSWLWVLVTAETMSVLAMMTRWSVKLHAGDYDTANDEEIGKFLIHLLIGVLPVIGVPFVLGGAIHRVQVRRAAERKKLAAEERELERMLGP